MVEPAEKQASKPKFRQIELNLKKYVVLIYWTDELLQDCSVLESVIRTTAANELAFQVDEGIFNGTGAGTISGF